MDDRCPHFHIEIQEQPAGLVQPLRAPVYHCKVSAVLVDALNTLPDGTVLAEQDRTILVAGPDGFPITAVACTVRRYEKDCRPGGDRILQQAGLGPLKDLRTFPHTGDNVAHCAALTVSKSRSVRLKATLQRARSLYVRDAAVRLHDIFLNNQERFAALSEQSVHLRPARRVA